MPINFLSDLASPSFVTPILGTPSSGTLTSCVGLPIIDGTTGILSVARGGTGVITSTGTGSNVLSASPTFTGTVSGPLGYLTNTTNTTTAYNPVLNDPTFAPAAKYLWHDRFAFNQTVAPTYETTLDNTTWTAGTLTDTLKLLFIGKENQAVPVVTAAQRGCRFTWYSTGFNYSYIQWYAIGITYTATNATKNIIIESSLDGITWTTRHNSTTTTNANVAFCQTWTHGNSPYIRITFLKTTQLLTAEIRLSTIKALSSRWGDQGLGSEYEFPYSWDVNKKMTLTNLNISGVTGGQTLETDASKNVISVAKQTGYNLALSTTATDIKINGTQSLGSLSTLARADHVHPVYAKKTSISRAINTAEGWVKIWSNTAYGGVRTTDFKITGGYNNCLNLIEFITVTAFYGFNHSIVTKSIGNYNSGNVLQIRTNYVSSTTTEVWVKLNAVNATQPGTITFEASDTLLVDTPIVEVEPTWDSRSVYIDPRFQIGDVPVHITCPIIAPKIMAGNSAGLALYEDGGQGIFIKDGGNVGIGTTSTNEKLDVRGKIYIESQGVDWNEITPGLVRGALHFDPVGDGANNTGNAITFGASDTGSGATANAGIYTRSDGTYGTKMYFATTDSYALGSKARMMIDHSGKVGIGTATPAQKLDVVGSIAISENIELGHATDTTITRVSAGRIAVEGVNVVTTSSEDSLENKTFAVGATFKGSTSGGTYLQASAVAGTTTLTLPAATDTLVGRDTTDTLTFKTLFRPTIEGYARFEGDVSGSTTLQASEVAGTTFLTLPAETDTLVGTNTNDTLTNKTLNSPEIVDYALFIGDTSGATKLVATAVAGNTTLTLPAETGTLVTLAGAETLVGKTLTSPVINSPTGLVKGDVGLGNVDNTSNATERAAAATLANKTLTTPIISGAIELGHASDTTIARSAAGVVTIEGKTIATTNVHHHFIHAGWFMNYPYSRYIPLNGSIIEQNTAVNSPEYVNFTWPYDGFVKTMWLRSKTNMGSTNLGLYKGATGATVTTALGNVTATVGANAAVEFDFTSVTNTYSQGDTMAILCAPTENPNGGQNITIELVFDLTT
jgi:hypothetical protein